ncbi:hypothetical protein RCL_jg13999.t1 [Rhizophagus clarus]|uniref:Uncharacterized protein n=1 Tax=Rhizophagus clarus TaxID=94130 RepID=A0A8H3QTW0_9GLOM|nr:hypothetical protein RCL_jg13999.t1 [Rhizophagus clarus]
MTKMNVKTKSFRGGKTTDYIRFRRRFRKVNAAVNRYRIRKFIYIIMSITTMRYVDMTEHLVKAKSSNN